MSLGRSIDPVGLWDRLRIRSSWTSASGSRALPWNSLLCGQRPTYSDHGRSRFHRPEESVEPPRLVTLVLNDAVARAPPDMQRNARSRDCRCPGDRAGERVCPRHVGARSADLRRACRCSRTSLRAAETRSTEPACPCPSPRLPLLEDALGLCVLYLQCDTGRYERTAVRWLERLSAEKRPSLEDLGLAVGALTELGNRNGDGAASMFELERLVRRA
jgi:hypothetical protein